MNLTYECGTCNTSYSFDTTHITTSGVKVTCPKCLTFFFFKNKDSASPEPLIEKMAEKDGVFEINFPTSPRIDVDLELPEAMSIDHTDPKLDASLETLNFLPTEPMEETLPIQKALPDDLLSAGSFDELLSRKDLLEAAPPEKSEGIGTIDETGKFGHNQNLTSAELSDYPEELPPESKLDGLLIPLSLIVVALSALLFLNYKGIIFIPGLENLRAEKLDSVPEYTLTPQPAATPQAKFGFPVIEDSPASPEVTPTAETTAAPPP